jgi:hypothetical protein
LKLAKSYVKTGRDLAKDRIFKGIVHVGFIPSCKCIHAAAHRFFDSQFCDGHEEVAKRYPTLRKAVGDEPCQGGELGDGVHTITRFIIEVIYIFVNI